MFHISERVHTSKRRSDVGDSMTEDSELAWTCVQDSRLTLNPHSLVVVSQETKLTKAKSNSPRNVGGIPFP